MPTRTNTHEHEHDMNNRTTAIYSRRGVPISLEAALDDERDMLPVLRDARMMAAFEQQLDQRRNDIIALAADHLAISPHDITIDARSAWLRGSHNVCLPLTVAEDSLSSRRRRHRVPPRLLIRFASPFHVGEQAAPGTVDEKIRCEAATYSWLRATCPDIPTPRLLGWGSPDLQSFMIPEAASWWRRLFWHFQRQLAKLRGRTLTTHLPFRRSVLPHYGYLIVEEVQHGRMLSSSWHEGRTDAVLRGNLYRSLALILSRLARTPLPRIGSWTVCDGGVLSLTNRPLTDLTLYWNRLGIPAQLSRHTTFNSTPHYLASLLSSQDARMRHQKNSTFSRNDGIFQLSALVGLRAILHRMWEADLPQHDSFVLTLPDLHQSNIFVDEYWNITSVIDLEFAPVVPIQLATVPPWLTGKGVDELDDDAYALEYAEFVSVMESLEQQEKQRERAEVTESGRVVPRYSSYLRDAWKSGRFWIALALLSANAFPAIWEQHLLPRFFPVSQTKDQERIYVEQQDAPVLAALWSEDMGQGFLEKKLASLEEYKLEIVNEFECYGTQIT